MSKTTQPPNPQPSVNPQEVGDAQRVHAAKRAGLASQNALHPHPELVTDPLFAVNPFFDPCDAIQVKYEMLRKVHADGASISLAVRAFGLSRPTFYDAQQELAQGGMPALLPLKKGPRRPHKVTGEVLAFILKTSSAEPRLSPAAIALRIQAQLGVQIHGRTVARTLEAPPKKS